MKTTRQRIIFLGVAGWLAFAPAAWAQRRPHIGYTYPAGGQQGTTFEVKLGGQELTDVNAVFVSGAGVSARVLDYYRKLSPQEMQLLREQLRDLKRTPSPAVAGKPSGEMMESTAMLISRVAGQAATGPGPGEASPELLAKVEQRIREWVQNPACASIANLVLVEVTVAPDAPAGPRELRLGTSRGVSNPLPFVVGQLAENTRKPMVTATLQVLGKEALALRKRPAEEVEDRIALPCTVNGQIASGEVNRYRFEASKGQRLVISTLARQLIPYIADAVPGWFQPVLTLHDAQGREVAFADDYRFKPDPVILYEVPHDGEYVFAIRDSIYRGREDFVYRITVGELPFVTSLFPLGGQVGAAMTPGMEGLNLRDADLAGPPVEARPGLYQLAASRTGFASNRVPFILDTLPDEFDREPNNAAATAQPVTLPVIVNGRIDRRDDWDVYQFTGHAKEQFVAEVQARRLDSPLDSVLKLTDAAGRLLAFSDDHEDLTAGLNTHHADSYLTFTLPADGTYFLHLGDTARQGGAEYGYRLRLSGPRPDFELRVVPSSVALALRSSAAVTVFAVRREGFTGPIRLALQDPPAGFSAATVTLAANQTTTRFAIKGPSVPTPAPVRLTVVGRAKLGDREVIREAVPAEDKMQAFLWRHLVPASDFLAVVADPKYQPPSKRVAPPPPAVAAKAASGPGTAEAAKPKFTKQQIAGRLRQLKLLYEEGLLTDAFYFAKLDECGIGQ